jgi:hypothetical protein
VSAVFSEPSTRLALSRDRLRQAMRGIAAVPDEATGERAGGSAPVWLDNLKSIPGAGVVVEALRSWWAQHPLRMVSMVAADAAKTVVQPIALRNPLGLVAAALLLGGLLAWSRPWRWILKPALFAGMLPHLISKAMAHVPPRSWMAVWTALAKEQRRPERPAAP